MAIEESLTMQIFRAIENHCGIDWEKHIVNDERAVFFQGDTWCIEYDKKENCWDVWESLHLHFSSVVLAFCFMVARELIFEASSKMFVPMWEET